MEVISPRVVLCILRLGLQGPGGGGELPQVTAKGFNRALKGRDPLLGFSQAVHCIPQVLMDQRDLRLHSPQSESLGPYGIHVCP